MNLNLLIKCMALNLTGKGYEVVEVGNWDERNDGFIKLRNEFYLQVGSGYVLLKQGDRVKTTASVDFIREKFSLPAKWSKFQGWMNQVLDVLGAYVSKTL